MLRKLLQSTVDVSNKNTKQYTSPRHQIELRNATVYILSQPENKMDVGLVNLHNKQEPICQFRQHVSLKKTN